MPCLSDHAHAQAQAIRTDLFTATMRPELLPSLIFANLLSPRLRELARKAAGKAGSSKDQDMRRLHKFLNGHFYHAPPLEFARVWGFHEFERRNEPEEREEDVTTLDLLKPRLELHRHEFEHVPGLLRLLEDGAFPNYVYSNADLILAHGRRLHDLPAHPLGMTSCADECLLAASLAVAGGLCGLDDFVLVGSPFHYTLFLFQEGEGWWFNAKREILTPGEFTALCQNAQAHAGTDPRQQAFDAKVSLADRVITARGASCFSSGRSSLRREELEAALKKLESFLGIRPQPLNASVITHWKEGCSGELVQRLSACTDSEQAANVLVELAAQGVGCAQDARCAFRLRDAAPPEAFALAAEQGYRVYLQASTVESLEEAVELVRAIPGQEPVFHDLKRIGLPDEVLLFQTAGPDERALLLRTLLRFSPTLGRGSFPELCLLSDGWAVRCGTALISGAEL